MTDACPIDLLIPRLTYQTIWLLNNDLLIYIKWYIFNNNSAIKIIIHLHYISIVTGH